MEDERQQGQGPGEVEQGEFPDVSRSSPRANRRMPPSPDHSAMSASEMPVPSVAKPRVNPAWIKKTLPVDQSTPRPSAAARNMELKRSIVPLVYRTVGSPRRPSCMQPTSVMAPTQNRRVDWMRAAPVPSPRRSAARWTRSPSPMACPIAAPRTRATKAAMGRVMPIIMSTPMNRVNRPSAEKTAFRSPSGIRRPRSRPAEAPIATVAALKSVPNMCPSYF